MRTTVFLASLAVLAVVAAASCSQPPDDGAAPGPSSFLPTERVDVGEPWSIDDEPSSTAVGSLDEVDGTSEGQAAGGRAKCGDGQCGRKESCSSCAADCGACPPPPSSPVCGDGTCAAGETCTSCAGDCGACPVEPPSPSGPVCGDAVCAGLDGELCTNCADCVTTSITCGNGACQAGETASSCRPDCGVDPWPSTSASYESEVVRLINQHRAAGTDCPSGAKSPVPPLSSDALLQKASRLHSWDQSFAGYFSHTSCNGRSPWTRAADVGTSATGETIAWGYGTPADAVRGWMTSTTGHCDILMSTRTVVGVGYAGVNQQVWTAMFR